MAGFNEATQLQRYEQRDEKGTTVTIYDLHDYSGSTTEGIVYADVVSRVFMLYNAAGELIGSIDATPVLFDNNSITVDVTKDMFIASNLIITLADSTVYTNIVKMPLIQQSQYKLSVLANRILLNPQPKIQDIMTRAYFYVFSALEGHKYGYAPYLFDEKIDAANKLLNSLSYC